MTKSIRRDGRDRLEMPPLAHPGRSELERFVARRAAQQGVYRRDAAAATDGAG